MALLVFCAAICTANSFKCYKCRPAEADDEQYTKEQCEKNQKEVECNSTLGMVSCFRSWGKMTDGKKFELRDCAPKSLCEGVLKQFCTDKAKMKESKIKECEVRCCQSDLCNSAFSTSANMMMMVMMMFASLCGVMLF